ncbi:MAG TPA: PQQ-binding-like beta-propeller repeat protein [Gaiellaceae bacterium]
MRRAVAGLALAALLAGCGWQLRPTGSAPTSPGDAPVKTEPRLRDVLVTVLDGDTGRRLAGVRVAVGRRSALTNAKGVAGVPIRRRAALVTTARHRGYIPRAVRLWYRQHPRSTMRIYQRSLQWPVYGADAARTQAQSTIRVRPPFRVVWSRGIGSLIEFPAVVAEGVAYIGNYHGTIYAISMRNGKVSWRYDPPGGKMASSPAVYGDELVVHGMDGVVRVLDRDTGKLKRQLVIGSPIESSPVIANGLDLFGTWDGRVYALDLERTRVRWTYRSGCKITSSAALAGGSMYIGDYCGRVLALAPKTGSVRWSRGVNGRVYGTPAVGGGRVFVPSSTGGSLTAFTTGGRRLWSRGTGAYVYSSPALSGGHVYFGSYNGLLYCVSAATGATNWTVSAGGPISGAVTLVGGVAYAGSTRGRIVGADAHTGRVLLRFPHGEYVPVSGSGRRLLLHGYSRLYAVEGRVG